MSPNSATYGVVFVTASSKGEAEAIAQTLIQNHLAACVTILPVHSIYTWQGAIQHDDEWQLMIKTDLNQFTHIETTVRAMHSYEVPEVIALPITLGSQPYLQWLGSQMQ